MLKKNLSKSALVVALLTTTVIWRGTTAYAEDPNQAFTLDPMIVTAQRTETRDLDTPATTNIITEQNIKEAGYKNVFDAIEHQVGLTSTGYGDAGQDFGFSSGRTVIRGYDRGTLVMVDGIPMNLKNYNSLDGIPIDMVQQIEIIKGAAGEYAFGCGDSSGGRYFGEDTYTWDGDTCRYCYGSYRRTVFLVYVKKEGQSKWKLRVKN